MGEAVVSSEDRMEAEMGAEEETKTGTKRTENKDGSSEVVRWEKFLPKMVLRVLLVEADDSTRQIIAALLRKCSYVVAAVADGLMAWETLKGRPNNIDLILTEVQLPSISGYALLTLVMEHEICKNIPVIMMSSHDSISMVLKCMLKGAADFLIKPIRRNELRNLWQHVWRRHTLAVGNIPSNSPIEWHKVEPTSENNESTSHSRDYATSSQKTKEFSERGSDTQGLSRMKDRSASNLSNTDGENYRVYDKLDRKSVTPESETGERSSRMGAEAEPCNEAYYPIALRMEPHGHAKTGIQDECRRPEDYMGNSYIFHARNDGSEKPYGGAINLIGTFDNVPKCIYEQSSLNHDMGELEVTLQSECHLIRYYPSTPKNKDIDERHALNHSNASAFSRYNSKMLRPFFPTSTSNSTKFKDDGTKCLELLSNPLSQNNVGASQQPGASGSSSQDIMTSLSIGQSAQAEVAYPRPQLGMVSVPGVRLDNLSPRHGEVIAPVYCAPSVIQSVWSPKLAGQQKQFPFPPSTSAHSNAEIHESEQNYRQPDEATNNSSQNVHQESIMEFEEEVGDDSPAGQSNSTYGSICSRNDGNAMFTESLKNGGLVSHDGSRGMDSHRSSQREAALTKFRLKRKERCYEKKVRYQSRKRLAEQRPRVKGQFVRQMQNEAAIADANG